MQNKSITFTSKIRFVDRNIYNKMVKNNKIGYFHNTPNILKADEFYSEEIRTCTGGGLVNPHLEAEGFHFWDDKPNIKNFPDNINKLFRFVKNPERGILIGSKQREENPYSLEMFTKFKKVFFERVKNISLFEKHKFEISESNYHYSLKDDTWTIYSAFRRDKNSALKPVKNLDDLLECFENVLIADGDRLFIGKKEILPQDCPEIFAHKA